MKKLLSALTLCTLSFFNMHLQAQQPMRNWTSYYGTRTTYVDEMCYDTSKAALYIAGITQDTNSVAIATPGTFHEHYSWDGPSSLLYNDFFLTRFDTAGNRIWGTYIGGRFTETNISMVTDRNGNIYVAGITGSDTGIASPGAFQTTTIASQFKLVTFLMKFSSTGQRLWGTYIGESLSQTTSPYSYTEAQPYLAVDSNNNVYIGNYTNFTQNIATPGSFHASIIGGGCPYLVKFNSSGQRLWGTYLGVGNSSAGQLRGLAFSPDGNLYVSCYTSDTGLATPGAEQTSVTDTTYGNICLFKSTLDGQRVWSTYMDANGNEHPNGLKSDGDGNVYIYGNTMPTTNGIPSNTTIGIATPGAYQDSLMGGADCFLIKYTPEGHKAWGTYFGGNSTDAPYTFEGTTSFAISGGDSPAVFIAGQTYSTNHISTSCTYPAGNNKSGFIAKFDTSGQRIWGSYYDEEIHSIAWGVPAMKQFYIGTEAYTAGLATPGAFNETYSSGNGLFGKFEDKMGCPQISITLHLQDSLLMVPGGYASYKWYHNDSLLAAVTDTSYVVPSGDTGIFYVVIHDSCGCSYQSTRVHIGNTTSIPNIASQNGITVFPNPAENSLHIKYDLSRSGNFTISNSLGQQILSGRFNNTQTLNTIDIGKLHSGIYFISIGVDNKQATFKFLKN